MLGAINGEVIPSITMGKANFETEMQTTGILRKRRRNE